MLVLVKHRLEKRSLWVKSEVLDAFIGSMRVSVLTIAIPEILPRKIAARQINGILSELLDDSGLVFCLSNSFAESGYCEVMLRTPDLSVITSSKAGQLAFLAPTKKDCALLSSDKFSGDELCALEELKTRFRYIELDLPGESFLPAQEILISQGISPRRCQERSFANVAVLFKDCCDIKLPPDCIAINASGKAGISSLVSYSLSYPRFFKCAVTENFRIDEIIAYALTAGVIDSKDIAVSDAKFCNNFRDESVLHLDNSV